MRLVIARTQKAFTNTPTAKPETGGLRDSYVTGIIKFMSRWRKAKHSLEGSLCSLLLTRLIMARIAKPKLS